jgi:hypothetical protein
VSPVIFCCSGVVIVVLLIYVPIIIVRKGFDLAIGCFGNIFVLVIAAILLTAYIVIADIEVCQIVLVGEPLCSILSNF